jgi:serine phosphatase RsbU (regulator of sigma subunit)/HAMP domain-containing protein
MRLFNSIQTRLLLTLLAAVLVTALLVAWGLLQSARRQMRSDLSSGLARVAGLAAMQIDGDVHATLRHRSQQFSPSYNHIREQLQGIVATDPRLRYAYTLRAVSPDSATRHSATDLAQSSSIVFVVDADPDPESMGNLGERYEDASPFLSEHIELLDRPEVEKEFYTDRWGTFLSGYAPIRTSGGAIDGILGVDIEASWILAKERSMILLALAITGAALLPIVLLGIVISRRLSQPVINLHDSVVQVSGGDLSAQVGAAGGINRKDEIGDLARAFNKMTSDLRGHITKLAEEQAARKKIEQDLELARKIQLGLLPKELPNLPGYEIAGWNQPADQTGGDYFDWLELPDGRTLVMLADVTGHGIGPALIVAACRAYLRAAATTDAAAARAATADIGHAVKAESMGSFGEWTLSTVLSRVNKLLHHDVSDMRFVTAAVSIIDPITGQMSISSAGHAPLLYYRAASGEVTVWNADDLPLAIDGNTHYPAPRTVTWQQGDMLVLVTDGFFEWANKEGNQFGTVRLRQFVVEHADLAPAEFIRALHEAVLAHAGGTKQADDLTAVVVKKV